MVIDLNCDMGESFGRFSIGNDMEIMKYISSCNIACGFHGGDPKVIIETIKEADKNQVKIGAHPSYPDLQGFGRRKMIIPKIDLVPIIQYQIAVIDKLAELYSNGLHHVKPHGALYNHAFDDIDVAESIVEAFAPWSKHLVLYVQYGSELQRVASESGIKSMAEGFADRKYTSNLNLMSRTNPEAVHSDIDEMTNQVLNMVSQNKIQTNSGEKFIDVQTICIHGDHPKAIEIVQNLAAKLHEDGIKVE